MKAEIELLHRVEKGRFHEVSLECIGMLPVPSPGDFIHPRGEDGPRCQVLRREFSYERRNDETVVKVLLFCVEMPDGH